VDKCFFFFAIWSHKFTGKINVACCLTKQSKSHEYIYIQRQPIQCQTNKRQDKRTNDNVQNTTQKIKD